MTDHCEQDSGRARAPMGPSLLRCPPADLFRAAATVTFVCAFFAAVASFVLIGYTRAHPELDAIQLPGGLVLRAALFGVLSALSAGVLWKLRQTVAPVPPPPRPVPASRGAILALAALLVAIALLLGAHIGQYPWAAPDEVHHLVVARNLALHGSYASGHPDTGLTYFDSFDSVGPAVIGPLALAFKVAGVHLAVARLVMVAFFISLCGATFCFTRGLFGDWPGVAAVALLAGAYSSIYLGRTVYGEVPAYLFLLLGLLAWRRALGANLPPPHEGAGGEAGGTFSRPENTPHLSLEEAPARLLSGTSRVDDGPGAVAFYPPYPPYPPASGGDLDRNSPAGTPQRSSGGDINESGEAGGIIPWGLLAGALVACAVLSKAIVVLVAFSFAGAWLQDRFTRRTIRWPHVVFPCAGGLAVLVAWAVYRHVHAGREADPGSVLAIYQHYLLFGLSSFGRAFAGAIAVHPVAHLVLLGIIATTVPMLFRHRYDPPAMVLFLYALFVLYWWFFFTPGQLYRYLWNAYAILAIFTAPWLIWAIQSAWNGKSPIRSRVLSALLVLLIAGPGALWIAGQAGEVVTRDEMAADGALVDAVSALPRATRAATDIDRLPGVLNFFDNRAIGAGSDPVELLRVYDMVITRDSSTLRAQLPPGCRVKTVGAFVLLSTAQPTE